MGKIYEHRVGRAQRIASAAVAACVVASAAVLALGSFWQVAAFLTGVSMCLMTMAMRLPVHGLRLEGSQLVIAPRHNPYAIPFEDILGVHITLDPLGDHCRIHMSGGERVSISPLDCPKGLTLKSELEYRGILAALR